MPGGRLRATAAVIALPRAELDISEAASVRHCLEARRPALVIHAPAYTAVTRAKQLVVLVGSSSTLHLD